MAVPSCCQRELSAAWRERPELGPWAASPHLRRTAAATTDTYRMLLLRTQGYEASAVEFIDALHTPKEPPDAPTLANTAPASAASDTAGSRTVSIGSSRGASGGHRTDAASPAIPPGLADRVTGVAVRASLAERAARAIPTRVSNWEGR